MCNPRMERVSLYNGNCQSTNNLTDCTPEYSSTSFADYVINAHLQFKEGHCLCLLYNKSSPPNIPQSLYATLDAASGDGTTSNKTFRHWIPIIPIPKTKHYLNQITPQTILWKTNSKTLIKKRLERETHNCYI